MRLARLSFALALVALIATLFAAAPAWAQLGGNVPHAAPKGGGQPAPQALPPPPALPGATPGLGAAPADKSTADMSPTDELFDAVNRGDIASARDSLSRGADINGRNVLGMTPLELSIDLSRNDITFLLLSMQPGGAPPPSLAQARPPAGGKKPALSPNSAAAEAALLSSKPSLKAIAKAPAKPVQYAGPAPSDPGTPAPQAGFLGFGGGVQ
jgi:hypothetical protein